MRRLLFLLALVIAPAAARADGPPAPTDLTSIGLEDLMQLEVTSVSRREEPLFRAASAITVLTAEDIAHSGATNIPDLLRRVPGMHVAQANANTWSVSARGFGGQYANKMLVLVDGRTVYNPVFLGVYWDAIDVLIADVQRIEVIRGPGATAWGANAVNGVINIITRPASAAPGLDVIAGGSSLASGFAALRYAAPAGQKSDFRLSAKVQRVGRLRDADGAEGHDGLDLAHVGGRFDWRPGARDEASIQGTLHAGTVEQRNSTVSLDPPYAVSVDYDGHVRGGNLMASWQRTFSPSSDLRLKAYVDHSRRPGAIIKENLRTFDFDFQHRLALGSRHDFMWGGGYRLGHIEIGRSATAWFDPSERTTRLGNVFLQDAIAVLPERVTLTLGSKFEHNDFSGVEVEPSARLLWAASPTQTLWGAASRAVRTPGPTDEDLNYNQAVVPLGPGMIGVARLIGSDMRSEIMTALELGWRAQLHPRLSLDLASFQSTYSHLRGAEPGAPFPESDPAPPHLVIPVYFVNGHHARTRGLESRVDWRPAPRFGVTVSHSLFWMRVMADEGTLGTADGATGDTPTYQLVVQPHVTLSPRVNLDAAWYHVDDQPAQGVRAYDRVDARLGWTPRARLELSGGVRNLFHDQDLEWANNSGTNAPTLVRTSVYGKVTWSL